jgi:bifunctional NMN adenylyltransferase/nudix hydrolase
VSNNNNVGTPVPREHHSHHLGVFIGRFQPFHNGHLHVITQALESCDTLVVLIGSSDEPRDYFNPFTYEERMAMIMTSLPPKLKPRVICRPLLDWTYNDPRWIKGVQDIVRGAREHFKLDDFAKIALVGHQKDGTSFYLKLFPQWDSLGVPGFTQDGKVLSATDIRNDYFLADETDEQIAASFEVAQFLRKFRNTDAFETIRAEYLHVEKYNLPYKDLPYPPIFHTVDAVVVQSGHVLLVKRRGMPGRGLWALPGGFLNAKERIEDAYLRELREETRIKVPEPVLRGCTTKHRYFDAVYRSARGRTITEAFLIELPDNVDLPKVKGADDAEKARWVPLSEVKRNMMFEDHFHLISVLTGAF